MAPASDRLGNFSQGDEKTHQRAQQERRPSPIADGLAAAHQKRISKGKLANKFCYILKAPKKAYRLYKWETLSPDGEIIPKFKQWKDDLRPVSA